MWYFVMECIVRFGLPTRFSKPRKTRLQPSQQRDPSRSSALGKLQPRCPPAEKLWPFITSYIDKNKQTNLFEKKLLRSIYIRVISCLMSRLERAGTLGRVSQSLAVLGSSLLPPPVLQLVHHLPLVFCIINIYFGGKYSPWLHKHCLFSETSSNWWKGVVTPFSWSLRIAWLIWLV